MVLLTGRNVRPREPFGLNEKSWQAKGLAAWYPMIELGGMKFWDLSGNDRSVLFDNVGTPGSAPRWKVENDIPNLAFGLGGVRSITIPDPLGTFSDATLWFWLRSQGNTGNGSPAWMTADATLFSHYPFTNDNTAFYSNHLSSTRSGPYSINQGGTKFYTGEHWHAMCVRTTPGTNGWQWYFDQLLLGQRTGDSSISIPSNKWLLGYSSDSQIWNGYLAEFRIYNRALTQAEIFELSKPNVRFDLYKPLNPRVYPKNNATAAAANAARSQIVLIG